MKCLFKNPMSLKSVTATWADTYLLRKGDRIFGCNRNGKGNHILNENDMFANDEREMDMFLEMEETLFGLPMSCFPSSSRKPQMSRKKANRHRGSKGHKKDLARHGARKLSKERYWIDSEYTSRKVFRDAYYGREGRNHWQYDNGNVRNCRKATRKGEPIFIPEETVTLQFEMEYVSIGYDDEYEYDTIETSTEKDYDFSMELTPEQIPFWVESYLYRKYLSSKDDLRYDEVYLYPLINGERNGDCYRVDTPFFNGI